jgi:hypothetical protein
MSMAAYRRPALVEEDVQGQKSIAADSELYVFAEGADRVSEERAYS